MTQNKKFWKIEILEGMEVVFETAIPRAHLTTEGFNSLFKMLNAKYCLSDEEIISENLRKNTRRYKSSINYEPTRYFDLNISSEPLLLYHSKLKNLGIYFSLIDENALSIDQKKMIERTSTTRFNPNSEK
jgi:hypothetical protein